MKVKKRASARGISRFLATALAERIERIEREEALKKLLSLPPTFEDIGDSVAYIRAQRQLDNKRAERLGI